MDEFLTVLEDLIAYFVQRQRVVVLAMLDIHPTALGGTDQRILGIRLEPYWQIHREKVRIIWEAEDKEARHGLFEGVWKSDWKFLRHGRGCKLINLRTDEPIEWDAPDPYAISLHWFLANLEWRLRNEAHDPFVRQCHQWLEQQHCGVNEIKQILYLLIDRQILFLKQDHTCCLRTQRLVEHKQIPSRVSEAVHNLIMHYKERQQIVIATMVELRPDIIKIRSDERFLDPVVAARLRALVANSDTEFRGWLFTKGTWGNDSWDYDIGYARCTITNRITGERLTWAASDPLAAELDGFRQHLQWRIENQAEDENVKICTIWHNDWDQNYRQELINAMGEDWSIQPSPFSSVWALLNDLIELEIIVLKQDDYGLMIK